MKRDPLKLTQADATALFHAVQWMSAVLGGWPADEDPELRKVEAERVAAAKKALRKVQAIRRAQKSEAAS